MKKNILLVASLFAGALAFGQGTTTSVKNTRGMEYLPQAGDWAIQFDAAPVLNYVGNAFSTGGTSSPGVASTFGNSVFVGKYFKTSTFAYRAKLGINLQRETFESTSFIPGVQDYVVTEERATTSVILGFGLEKRRGHNRLQGFYGAEALVQIGSFTPVSKFSYNQTVDSAFRSRQDTNGRRSLGATESSAFGVGARAFIGVEYFVLPKISIGGEFGWGFGYMASSGKGQAEFVNPRDGSAVTADVTAPSYNGFVVNNDNGGSIFGGSASLNFTFHF